MCSSDLDNKIAWYVNSTALGVDDYSFNNFSIYPNPVKDILRINTDKTSYQIEVYNALGEPLILKKNVSQIVVSTLSQGIYFIKIKDEKGNYTTKKIMKE